MWISSPSWMRNCSWKALFLLPWEWYFLPSEDLFFYMFKSSNLTQETDNRSLVSVNDCLLMFQANSRLRRDKGIIFWVSDRKLHSVHAFYNPARYKEKIPICKVNGTIYRLINYKGSHYFSKGFSILHKLQWCPEAKHWSIHLCCALKNGQNHF